MRFPAGTFGVFNVSKTIVAGQVISKKGPLTAPSTPNGCFRDEKGIIRKTPEVIDPADMAADPMDRLAAMRWVLKYSASADKTQAQKACRTWLKKAPSQFMVALGNLESARVVPAAVPVAAPSPAGASDSHQATPAVEEDVVGEKLEVMIETWLAETGKRVAGSCPCCGQKVREVKS